MDQTYIMADDTLVYSVRRFSTGPAECLIRYYFSSSPPFGSGLFSFDGVTGVFNFYADNDLSLAGRSYNLSIEGEIGDSKATKSTKA